jgi:hypothetical protein
MLGDACGDCSIVVGDGCVPCPNGADFPECAGCIDGARPEKTDITKDLLIPIVVGVATTLAVALLAHKLMNE